MSYQFVRQYTFFARNSSACCLMAYLVGMEEPFNLADALLKCCFKHPFCVIVHGSGKQLRRDAVENDKLRALCSLHVFRPHSLPGERFPESESLAGQPTSPLTEMRVRAAEYWPPIVCCTAQDCPLVVKFGLQDERSTCFFSGNVMTSMESNGPDTVKVFVVK